MALQKKITRGFSYKRVEGYKNTTFDELLRLAVKSNNLIRQRKLDVSDAKDGETFNLLSDFFNTQTYFAGVLCSYSPGRHQQVFPFEDDAATIPLASITPPVINKNGKHLTQEFLEGCLYFMIRENHVVLSQSMGFHAEKAELYFNWFLRERAKIIQPPTVIYLKDQLPPAKTAKIRHVRNLTIANTIQLSADTPQNKSNEHTFGVTPKGPLWDALKAMIPGLQDQYSLSKAITTEVLQASLTLRLGRKGKDAEDFVDAIATTMRNQDGLDFTIDMGKYGKLKSSEFKLGRQQVFSVEAGKINQLEVFRKMNDWLDELIATKRVHKRV